MKIVCLGDSLTYGYGVRRRDVWTSLASELSGDLYINKGINGDTTGGMLSRFYEDVLMEKPKAVLLMGGANDFIMGEPASRVQANMSSMAYQSLARGILPILGIEIDIIDDMVYPEWKNFADFSTVRNKLCQYRGWVGEFAKIFGIDYIDAYRPFYEYDAKRGRDLYSDGLHLNVEGNRLMASIISEAMSKLTRK
ncbi:MAG: arylesterase [Peptostreptococcaceae bacterium]|nr:arylesterase [Peptostreptococcaceae bacterium]